MNLTKLLASDETKLHQFSFCEFDSLVFLNHFSPATTSLTSLFLMMKMGSATVKDKKKVYDIMSTRLDHKGLGPKPYMELTST